MTTSAPYVGSKITLISKSEIRYDGILYDVDTKDATVTLSKGLFSRWMVRAVRYVSVLHLRSVRLQFVRMGPTIGGFRSTSPQGMKFTSTLFSEVAISRTWPFRKCLTKTLRTKTLPLSPPRSVFNPGMQSVVLMNAHLNRLHCFLSSVVVTSSVFEFSQLQHPSGLLQQPARLPSLLGMPGPMPTGRPPPSQMVCWWNCTACTLGDITMWCLWRYGKCFKWPFSPLVRSAVCRHKCFFHVNEHFICGFYRLTCNAWYIWEWFN